MSQAKPDRQKACPVCGAVFTRHPSYDRRQWASRLYCSKTCSGKAATEANAGVRPTVRAKFEERFQPSDGCWEWQGTIDGYGYGVLDHNRRRYRAHVLALEYDGRPVTDGMVACHTCDNPRCVRPGHLYPGTPRENVNDAMERGRLSKGEAHPQARLTEAQIREIRGATGTAASIGRRFGISRQMVSRIVQRLAWRHVE